METLPPEQPLPNNHQSEPTPAAKSPSNMADRLSYPPSAGSKSHLLYRCLLDQLAQKLKAPFPTFQTRNEGLAHMPMFRSTVTFDGVSYASSSTFEQRRMAEMDASRVAYIAITQKAKSEALSYIQECKTFCKSILVDFATKKDLKIPVYETTQLEASLPVFRSNLLFDGVTYQGGDGKTKKEAEQLAARSVIMKYLGTEAGNDMALVVNAWLRRYQEIKKVQINSAQISSNVLGAQTEAGTSTIAAPMESSLGQGTMIPVPSAGVPQPILPQLSVEPIIPVAPVAVQPPTLPQLSVEPIIPVASVAVQPPTPQVSSTVPVVTESSTSQVAVEVIKPAVAEVLTPISSAVVNNPCIPVLPAPLVEIPAATDLSSSVIQQVKAETSPAEALEYIPLVGETSKKRNRKNKKNARKKMRADAEMPVVPAS